MSSVSLPQSILQDRRLYEVLGIANFSSSEEVRVAFRALALKNHPDKNIGDPSAADRFREVSRAYEVLASPEHKKKYDVALRVALGGSNRHASPGHLGSNPYSVSPVAMSDIYKDVYRQQAERATTRTRPSSAAPQGAPAAAKSHYTKAQQDLFRKREKERQQELRRQLERERKEQRERERAALRREQEKQEELLQQRWQQQQQQRSFAPRMATCAATAKRTSSTSTVGTSSARYGGGLRGAEGSSRTATPRPGHVTPRAATGVAADDGLSGRHAPATPNTVRLNTPARSGTPRVRQTRPSTPSPGRRNSDRFGDTTPTSTAKENQEDRRRHRENGGGGGGHDVWFTPLTSPTEGSVYVLHTSTLSSSRNEGVEILEDDDDAAASSLPQTSLFMGFTAAELGTTSTAAEGNTKSTSDHNTRTGKQELANGRAASFSGYESPRQPSDAATTGPSRLNGHSHSPRRSSRDPVAAPAAASNNTNNSKTTTTPRQHATPRGLTSAYSTRTAAFPSATTPRTKPVMSGVAADSASSSSARTRPVVDGARTSKLVPRPKTNSTAPAASAQPVGVTPCLAESDKELLEKQRTKWLANEKGRQRTVRLTEEGQQFQRAARAMKQQQQQRRNATNGAAAVAAAAEEDVRLTKEELLMYVQADETSERQQFIEREEQLAWRRLQRQHLTLLAETAFKKKAAALMMEEWARRSSISSAAQKDGCVLGCLVQEGRGRGIMEWREGRERRHLKGREAADSYHVQRLSQRRSALLADEANQRRSLVQGALKMVAVLHLQDAEERHRVSLLREVQATRRALCTSFVTTRGATQGVEKGKDGEQQRQSGHALPPGKVSEAANEVAEDDDWPVLNPSVAFTAHRHSDPRKSSSVNNSGSVEGNADLATVVPLANDASPVRPGSTGSFHTVYSRNSNEGTAAAAASDLNTSSARHARSSAGSSAVKGERRTPADAPSTTRAVERRVQLLLMDEARQRGLLVSQRHHEEVALRHRRATALHRIFAKEKEEALRQAQKAAQAEIRALQSELRLLQRQRDAASALSTPLLNGSFSSSVSPPRVMTGALPPPPLQSTPLSLPRGGGSSTDTPPMKPAVVTGPPIGGAVAETAAATTRRTPARSAPIVVVTGAPARRHRVTSTRGWKALPDSDVEENE
ncbi:putative chaperone DNAJ protein [Leptomonas pyrrhocoris]|uniref:Putative chaperone DNAJ protein n=1 Tax=Leptomonas pyrrhocoris TaxID=157538 RepID=A0A0N1J4P6_LEPPY|nr:putative chaperone DNAJ protein [Leptomonas pyrrhocoris]KPA78632.1 putative chaperone DNAJ protein [Leptomonas pyrrhocoris]|eukprot:XP_015657071.1 putative chaperone DNAJ protein [Leptomonas pyrrhocoris]